MAGNAQDKLSEKIEGKNHVDEGNVVNSEEAQDQRSKEKELLEVLFDLESEKEKLIEEAKAKINAFKKDLEESRVENEKLKKRNAHLEHTVKQNLTTNGNQHPSKKEFDDVLTKAKTLLFEKSKICKQQEQHIEMLKTQIDSVKDVLAVTKEMLDLRNTEVEHMQTRLDTIDLRIKAEKDKTLLTDKKLSISKRMYNDLRKEYDCQSKIFKELRSNYEEKIEIITKELENEKAKNK